MAYRVLEGETALRLTQGACKQRQLAGGLGGRGYCVYVCHRALEKPPQPAQRGCLALSDTNAML